MTPAKTYTSEMTMLEQLEKWIGTDLYREAHIYALQNFRCKLTSGKPNAPKSYYGDGDRVEDAVLQALLKFRDKEDYVNNHLTKQARIQKAVLLLESVEKLEKQDCTLTLYKTFRGHIRGIYSQVLTGKIESDIETTFADALIKLSEGLGGIGLIYFTKI